MNIVVVLFCTTVVAADLPGVQTSHLPLHLLCGAGAPPDDSLNMRICGNRAAAFSCSKFFARATFIAMFD
jgi:hypothetical protein